MAQFGDVLTQQQVRDLAAYIADTPATSTTALDFSGRRRQHADRGAERRPAATP